VASATWWLRGFGAHQPCPRTESSLSISASKRFLRGSSSRLRLVRPLGSGPVTLVGNVADPPPNKSLERTCGRELLSLRSAASRPHAAQLMIR
jgi:hypothetical protein